MINSKIIISIIGIALFLFGLNYAYLSFVTYESLQNQNSPFSIPGSYLLSAFGGLLLMLAGIIISPIYEHIFKKSSFWITPTIRYGIFFLLLIIGFALMVLLPKEISVPAIS